MGALHEGHLVLMRRARQECDNLVLSVFVNPTQFGPEEDLDRYPRSLQRDVQMCRDERVDVVFAPEREAMYPSGFSSWVEVEGDLTHTLEGRYRPGHFRGVTTVVTMLLNIIMPHVSYFGQKDYQQSLVVKKIVKELHMPTAIVVVPTAREVDGLACSSRNQYLSSRQREAATVLYRSLKAGEAAIQQGEDNGPRVVALVRRMLHSESSLREEYVAVVEPGNMQPVDYITSSVVIALAARIGQVRLIDNIIART